MGTSVVGRFQKSKWQRKCIVLFCTYFLTQERGIWEESERQEDENYFKMPFVNHSHVVLRTRDHEETGKDKVFLWIIRTFPRKPPGFGREQEETSIGSAAHLCRLGIPAPFLEATIHNGLQAKGLIHKDNSNAFMCPSPLSPLLMWMGFQILARNPASSTDEHSNLVPV